MKKIVTLFCMVLIGSVVFGQVFQFKPNYDESKVPEFKIPDPLVTFSGKKVKNVKVWEKKRRPELLEFFTKNVYGEVPGKLKIKSVDLLEHE